MKSSEKINEKKLFREVKASDKDAFIKAYDLHVNSIYRFIYFKVNNQEEAQDITSAVFLKAWNHIQNNSLVEAKTLRALFYKIARTSIIDYYRQNSQANTVTIDGEDETAIDLPDKTTKSPLESSQLSSDIELIKNKLRELKDEYREVITLKYIDELSTGEISEILDKTNGNVRITLHRALQALKNLLDNENKK